MKVLQILPELNVGGVERGTVDFAKYLVSHDHKSIVISNGGTLVPLLEESGTKHYKLPVHKKSLWTMIRLIKKVRNIIVSERIDIVHARSRVPGWIAYFACRKTDASFITTCHGYYKNRIYSQVMGWPKLVIVPSMVIGRHMIDDFKTSTASIRCISRSVDLESFRPRKSKDKDKTTCTIAIVGRLTPLKGHTYFLKAMAKVARSIPYAKILIVGDAPKHKASYRNELEMLASKLGLKEKVEFLGSRKDIPEILSTVDVLVFSSVVPESFGRVIIEAQAVGVPVVATRVGGVVDIIDDGKTGILVMPRDVDAMAKEVVRVFNDKDLTSSIVAAAKKKIKENFTIEHMSSQTIAVYEELISSMHILIIKITSPGDVILATASIKAVRKKFPKAKIYCLVGAESRRILQNCPYLDGIIVYDTKDKDRGFFKMLKLSGKLRKYRFDKIIDFQNNRRSHILSFLSFPQESFGFDNGKWSFLLSRPVKKFRNDIAAVPHQFQILRKLGIPYKDNHFLELWPSDKDGKSVKSLMDSEWLGNSKNIVGINIAASEKWQTKNWPVENIAKLCDILSKKNIRVIVTGMEKDSERARELLSLTKSRPAVFVGKTDLAQLSIIIKKCKVYITPDSAPLHVAAAVQTPVVALFGPTDSARHIPPARKIVVMEKKLPCAPCYKTKCSILTHDCMKNITPEEIAEEIEGLMEVRR